MVDWITRSCIFIHFNTTSDEKVLVCCRCPLLLLEFAEVDSSSGVAGLSIFFWQEMKEIRTTAKNKYLNETLRVVITIALED